MTRGPGARWAAPLALACAAICAGCASGHEPPQRIVLIVIDTLRSDHVSAYGGRTQTPSIDGLAARGQVFHNAYSSFSQTSMSMASLFTGHTPSIERGDPAKHLEWGPATWCGMARYSAADGDESCVPGSLTTLAESLRAAGYETIGVCSNPYLYDPYGYSAGFDEWVEVGENVEKPTMAGSTHGAETRQGDSVNREVAAALAGRSTDRFFLYVHYMDVHDYSLRGISYERAVAQADRAIGELLRMLESRKLLDGAVVFLTADHGERLEGETYLVPGLGSHMGNPAFDSVLRVPLIVSPPVFEDSERFVRGDDVHRMIREVAGVADSSTPDLLPDEHFTSEQFFVTYRSDRWKSYHRRSDGRVFLVDLQADPGETRDVAEARPQVVERHRERARELVQELGSTARTQEMTSEDEERLRSLGYVK